MSWKDQRKVVSSGLQPGGVVGGIARKDEGVEQSSAWGTLKSKGQIEGLRIEGSVQ